MSIASCRCDKQLRNPDSIHTGTGFPPLQCYDFFPSFSIFLNIFHLIFAFNLSEAGVMFHSYHLQNLAFSFRSTSKFISAGFLV